MNSVGATGGRLYGCGVFRGTGASIAMRATGGRPRSAKGILVFPFVVFWHEKTGDRWSPLQ